MSLPVRPPIRPKALLTPCAAPLRAGPAEDVTRESPCEAFDVASDAFSFVLLAVLEAASAAWEVVEAWRCPLLRPRILACRSSNRFEGADIGVVRFSFEQEGLVSITEGRRRSVEEMRLACSVQNFLGEAARL